MITALLLLFVVIPGLFGQESCELDGYTQLNATNFIKAVKQPDDFDGHLTAVQTEASRYGSGVRGRLAVLNNQTKDDLAWDLMVRKDIDAAFIAIKCFDKNNCQKQANWNWTEDGSSKYLNVDWKPADEMDTSSKANVGTGCIRILRRWKNTKWTGIKWNDISCFSSIGAIYELITADHCVLNKCKALELCVSCIDEHICIPSNATTTPAATTTTTTEGTTTTTLPNMCDSGPCNNDGSCIDLLNGSYKCNCSIGFNGTNCELKTLETDVHTDFGKCPDNPDGFEYGDHCYFIPRVIVNEPIKETFEKARDICGEGAMLATPIHPILQQFFYAKMKEFSLEGIWIGLDQNSNSNDKVKQGWQIIDSHLGLNITVDYVFTPWQLDEPNDGDPSKIENGTENNAIMDSGGYFRDVNKHSGYVAAACQQKLYKKQLFKPLGIGRRISQPITAAVTENTMTKCIRKCYLSWACNAISYHRTTKDCHLHLLSVQDHKNVTVINDGGFEMLYREP